MHKHDMHQKGDASLPASGGNDYHYRDLHRNRKGRGGMPKPLQYPAQPQLVRVWCNLEPCSRAT